MDSSPKAESPQARADLDSSKSLSDSKILDEKCGSGEKSQGSYLSGSDRRDFSPLPHFSLKAESPQVDSSNDYSASAEFMDCHALPSGKARNDRGAVDYRATASTLLLAQNLWITKEAAATPCFATPLKRLAMTGKS